MKTKTPTVTHLYLCLLSVVITSSHTLFAQQAGTVQAIPTFQSIGLYWSGTGGDANTVCNVKYRVAGSDTWLDGYPLCFDSRAQNANDISGYRSEERRVGKECRVGWWGRQCRDER